MKLCESHQTLMQKSSNSYANVIKQLCKSRLKVMRKSTNSYAKVIKRLCKRRPTVMQKLSNSYANVVQYLNKSRPKVMLQLCMSRPTVVQKSSKTVWGYPSSARHRRHYACRWTAPGFWTRQREWTGGVHLSPRRVSSGGPPGGFHMGGPTGGYEIRFLCFYGFRRVSKVLAEKF